MRPALQRLVARPAARELLRLLAGCEAAASNYAPANLKSVGNWKGVCGKHHCEVFGRQRGLTSATVAAKEKEEDSWERETTGLSPKQVHKRAMPSSDESSTCDASKNTLGEERTSFLPSERHTRFEQSSTANPKASITNTTSALIHNSTKIRDDELRPIWKEEMWTHQELDFQTNLEVPPQGNRYRLLDSARYRHDLGLWALFLDYRKRIYGNEGVRMFWSAISNRGIQLPTSGSLADRFWPTFVDYGLENPDVLNEILTYADTILRTDGAYWTKLYSRIVQKLLTSQRGHLAQHWHSRLIQNYPPGPRNFAEMCRQVAFKSRDLTSLKAIYRQSPYRNIYAKIIPTLCERGHYKAALKWHNFLLKQRDIPSSAKVAFPLVEYLTTYEPANAGDVIKDLVAAGVESADEMSQGAKISREMMNLIHGETLNIPEKQYNDDLGARWFATKWISLDVAIDGVLALGVQEIGPLSLQAIALRETQLENIYPRIKQLKAGGVSLGKSLYSCAIESFSRDGKYDLLEGLLRSDQHPNELENYELQETLLASYARARDWPQYRRTLEIRLLKSTTPEIDKRNIELRIIAGNGDFSAIRHGVEDMIISGIEFKRKTIAHLIRCTLNPRRPGRRPVQLRHGRDRSQDHGTDLDAILTMLKSIVRSDSFVDPKQWHEIIRRLGMTGQLQTLGNLCLWLASIYGPANTASGFPNAENYRVPTSVPTSNPSHPLHVLFSSKLQRAIIEWGFITNSRHQSPASPRSTQTLPRARKPCKLTFGIYLLKRLNELGVHIDTKAVRRAIFDRLVTYYGPGVSNRRYNEASREKIDALENVAREIDHALDGVYFSAAGVGLKEMVEEMGMIRLRRLARRRAKGKGVESRDWRIERLRSQFM
ncbi:hypothetical protein QTJ16_005757 [Diplocarpon rosae]|uniref:Pentatricopeptide repeat domain-containing protein n=1 Tax=Diplocarpon rosae TaxID=946125 RepID=A0AAD9SX60_9HELO|nr:hypothetical protein QTJ16_005757 [Diplocarpon rosae]PBP16625.1 hypothetical protein BUE80_DR012490 [Diplocarpon rosae]